MSDTVYTDEAIEQIQEELSRRDDCVVEDCLNPQKWGVEINVGPDPDGELRDVVAGVCAEHIPDDPEAAEEMSVSLDVPEPPAANSED